MAIKQQYNQNNLGTKQSLSNVNLSLYLNESLQQIVPLQTSELLYIPIAATVSSKAQSDDR